MVHCVGMAPGAERPKIHDQLPTVEVPSNLFIRAMAPEDLGDLGFAPKTAACAALIPYSWAQLDTMEAEMKEVRGALDDVTVELRREDACFCSQLRGLDAEWVSPACSQGWARPGCKTHDIVAQRALAPMIAPVGALADALEMPMEHWRLAGRTDRAGFWEHRYRWLKRRFSGSSEAFEPGTPATTGPSKSLINALLEAPGVVMVVRQEGGRSIVVVREPGNDLLVFDLFRKPVYENESLSLLHKLDDIRPQAYLDALGKPEVPMKLAGDLRKSMTTWMSRDGLERVDAATRAVAFFFNLPRLKGVDEEVPPFADAIRWTTSVVEGADPSTSEVHMSLTDDGVAWVDTVRAEGFASQIYELAEAEEARESPLFDAMAEEDVSPDSPRDGGEDSPEGSAQRARAAGADVGTERDRSAPTFTPAAIRQVDIELALRPEVDGVWFHGLRRSVLFLSASEFEHTGTFEGTVDDWRLEVPGAFRLGDLRVVSAFRPSMSRLGSGPHLIEGGLVDGGASLWIRLRRR